AALDARRVRDGSAILVQICCCFHSLSFDSWNFLEASSFNTTCDNPFFRSRKHALLALPCPRKSLTSCIAETSTRFSHKTQNKIMYPPTFEIFARSARRDRKSTRLNSSHVA